MAKILVDGKIYNLVNFESENEFEKVVILNKKFLFGEKSVYIDIKKRIGHKDSKNKGLPDGYLIDFSSSKKPQLYLIENELSSHDVYKHISEQLVRFSTIIKTSPYQIRTKLIDVIKMNDNLFEEINYFLKETTFSNIDELMIFLVENQIKIALVIDEVTIDLSDSLDIFKKRPDVVSLQKYSDGKNLIYIYEPLREELEDIGNTVNKDPNELDTIVCPAFEEGFKHAYIENNAWWAIRISMEMQEKLKYLAIYENSPVSEVKHYAEIEKIEPYKDSGKYIVYLKNKKKLINPIILDKGKKGVAPQSSRYTTLNKLKKAKKISDLWV